MQLPTSIRMHLWLHSPVQLQQGEVPHAVLHNAVMWLHRSSTKGWDRAVVERLIATASVTRRRH
jgi:hypothetical protein